MRLKPLPGVSVLCWEKMDPLTCTNEDASRILRGILNIGQSSGTGLYEGL